VAEPFVSASCGDESCYCGQPAAHKIEEVIQWDDPVKMRHPLTRYVCHRHFVEIMGPAARDSRDGVGAGANTPYDEGPFTLSPLQVTVCELRDGDGTTYLAMLHHAWQAATDGMCVERRADKAEVDAEAAEWREFLMLTSGVKGGRDAAA
jgi:hypothetical protein